MCIAKLNATIMWLFYLPFTLSGAGNSAALCCLARLFHSCPSTLPGRLPCQRKEPRGRESIADRICSGFCGHCWVPGGASGQSRSEWQGEHPWVLFIREAWRNLISWLYWLIHIGLIIPELHCLSSGWTHSPPPGGTEVSGWSGPLPH